MEKSEIICRFLEADLCVHPTALQEIVKKENPYEFVERLINSVEKKGIITPDDLQGFEVVVKRGKKRLAEEYEGEIEVKDLSKNSPGKGGLERFVEHFNSRYEKGVKVFRERKHLIESLTVGQVLESGGNSEVRVIGLVDDMRKSRKGNIIITLEDPTGTIPVVILNKDRELVELSKTIVLDDVVCVEGVTGSREGGIIIAKDVSLPDVPFAKSSKRGEVPLAIALISDIHIGSYEFMEKEFLRFIKWLNCEIGTQKQRELAESVKYLVVAGDLVDGVGIYPGQIDDLVIKDIYEQYRRLSQLFELVPNHIEIIITPGNHDATRQAEPQPAIFEEFAPDFYTNPMIHMIGNPCYTTLHGTSILIYHGRSMDDIISTIPGMSYSRPEKAMLELLKKRQLVPIFGEKVPVSPSNVDSLFIDEIPDILHSGHAHSTGVLNYRGVTIINSGAFQSQTEYQKRLNMHPDPGKVPVFDLKTKNTTIMKFT
ncbi:MAG: DNA-directed DNA polymerase II small subunit [Candidatus Hydrothermarchaeales archaeon]